MSVNKVSIRIKFQIYANTEICGGDLSISILLIVFFNNDLNNTNNNVVFLGIFAGASLD